MDLGLLGKVALVTAASKGIGRAVVRRLATEGAHVVLSARDARRVADAVDGMRGLAGEVSGHAADLLDPAAVDALVPAAVAAHGRLDILVVNTPGPRLMPFVETTLDDWSSAFDTLLRPAVQLASAAARQMVAQGGGSIVFLTSTWVKQPAVGGVLSASMRSAISALSKQMALELAPHQVRVNQVMPGATATDRMKAIVGAKAAANGTTEGDEVAKLLKDLPLGRWAEPEAIADAVAFLVSPLSASTTGIAFQIDGGAVRSTV